MTDCAPALAEHGDIARIAAEGRDIVADPCKGCCLIQQAVVARRARFLGQGRMSQIPKGTEAVIDRDQHHAFFDEGIGLVDRLRTRAILVGAAMQPQHDRLGFAAFQIASAYIDEQAVFTFRRCFLRGNGDACGHAFEQVKSDAVYDAADKSAVAAARLDAFRPYSRVSRELAPHCGGADGGVQRRAVA